MLAPWARGAGHAARALRLVCGWGFSSLGLQVVKWYAYVGNEASRQTALAVGFQVPDHVFRGYAVQRGERRDAWIGTVTPDDLAAAARLGDARGRFLGPELTRRELDVLRQLTRGQANRTIATDLGISENTVKNHVRSILEKLQAKSRAEAVVIGLRQGLTTLGS
jgi:DNA-binding CsgD family transcriptional regulator